MSRFQICKPSLLSNATTASSPRSNTAARATRADQETGTDPDILLISDVSKAVEGSLASTMSRNLEDGKAPLPPPQSPLRSRVLASVGKVSKGLLERDTEVRRRYSKCRLMFMAPADRCKQAFVLQLKRHLVHGYGCVCLFLACLNCTLM